MRTEDDRAAVPLTGGNASEGVVRIGDTVRRPAGPWSSTVDALLRHMNEAGYEAAPRSLGFDAQGRHVVEYVPGDAADVLEATDRLQALRHVGRLIREFHDLSVEFRPPPGAVWNVVIEPDREDLVIHHDLAPWNLVRGGGRWVFIDWDSAGPGSRLWDLAYAAHGFVPIAPSIDTGDLRLCLAALADGYQLDEEGRRQLAALIPRRIRGMYELLERGHQTGEQPWARLWDEGHGVTWLTNADFALAAQATLLSALMDADQ